MGDNDRRIIPFYKQNIHPVPQVALLGSPDNSKFEGTTYDLQLGNWNINSDDWDIPQKFNTVICTRCAYFAKSPMDFFRKAYGILNKGGKLYVDWGLGDHWRFPNYKVGWVKDGEQEFAYAESNYLWSCVWDEKFEQENCIIQFKESVSRFGYSNITQAVYKECPSVCHFDCVKNANLFSFSEPKMIYCEKPNPSVLILFEGEKI
jgi:hypothetical protein